MTFKETREMRDDNCGTRFMVRDDGFEETISIAMRVWQGQRKYSEATALQMQDIKEGMPATPFISIQRESAQELFNQLWQIGFRPKDGTGNSGHIEALKYHLEDMRKLVFVTSKSNVDQPRVQTSEYLEKKGE